MKLASLVTVFVLVSAYAMPIVVAHAEGEGDSSAVGGGGGDGGSGGSGDTGGTGGDAGGGGDASGTTSGGDSSGTGGDGGAGGTGGDSTGGGATGTGGDGGSGGTGGGANNSADGGTSDATGGTGGDGGTGGAAEGNGTGGDGGTGAGGGGADSTSTTDDTSDADSDAAGGDGGTGGDGGSGTGANADGGDAGDAGAGGDADSDADAQNTGDADADATGGGGGDGGTGGSGGDGGSNATPDGAPSTITTGGGSSGSSANLEANTSDVTVPLGNEEEDDETELDFENVLGATTTASSTAETGENVIDEAEDGTIVTGMADAFAWIFALFNVAIVNSTGAIHFFKNPVGETLNFTQAFIDAFAEFASNGACSLTGCDGLDGVVLEVYDENVANVENSAVTRASSGQNDCESTDGTCAIGTGDADAMSGIVNVGNLTMVDSRYLLLFMANQGDLDGDILLPGGEFFDRLSTGAHIGARSDIEASSTADIGNIASTTAETGANTAIGPDGAEIESGNADATSANINFVNQLGAPICFIVAIGGDWNGDVVQLPSRFNREHAPFGEIICGAGGAERDPVTGLELEVENYARILNTAIAEAITGQNDAEGLVAKIKTGDASAFAQILNLVNVSLIGQDWIFANFAISGDWDGDLVFGVKPGEDDVLGELIEQHVLGGGGGSSKSNAKIAHPEISFTKTASVEQAMSPATIDYTLIVRNDGGAAGQVHIVDTMKGPDGKVIGKQMWNLGTVKPNEEVKVTYTVEFKGDVTPGYYTNTAVLTGKRANGSTMPTLKAEDVVEIGVTELTDSCEPVLTEYIRPWKINNAQQVKSLQSFLNAYEKENLLESGIYDGATQAAVKRFQSNHAEDILAPWGISKPTGNVYYTTQKKVNQMACADLDFSLTPQQLSEIEAFKASSKPKQLDITNQGNTGLVPKSLLEMPSFQAPVFFKTDASKGAPASTSAFAPFKSLTSWLFFAPLVEALEI